MPSPHLPIIASDLVQLQRLTGMKPDEVRQLKPVENDYCGKVWILSTCQTRECLARQKTDAGKEKYLTNGGSESKRIRASLGNLARMVANVF